MCLVSMISRSHVLLTVSLRAEQTPGIIHLYDTTPKRVYQLVRPNNRAG